MLINNTCENGPKFAPTAPGIPTSAAINSTKKHPSFIIRLTIRPSLKEVDAPESEHDAQAKLHLARAAEPRGRRREQRLKRRRHRLGRRPGRADAVDAEVQVARASDIE